MTTNATDSIEKIKQRITQTAQNLQHLTTLAPQIEKAAATITHALQNGKKILLCGNGGSAADSQHLAAELTGRYLKDRPPLAAIALTTDTSALTAIANDHGYQHTFARQLQAIGNPGDILIALSTSGNSPNILAAAAAAKQQNIHTIALTGASGGELAAQADQTIKAPATRTDQIQELHIVIGHILCEIAENTLTPAQQTP